MLMMSNSYHQQSVELKHPTIQEPFLPCHVCGEKAGKHSYYGGQVEIHPQSEEFHADHVLAGVPLL